jgi:hypothetical protein
VNNLTYICSQQTKKNNYGSWNHWRVLISAHEYIGTDGGDSKDKKGCGCMIVIILLLIIGGWLYYDVTY